MRIWLDRIGVKRRDRPEGWNRPVKRRLKCLLEKHIYGVDSRETYSLDDTWRMWLYEHLKMYLKKADPVVDLSDNLFTFNDEQYTQKELIEMMLSRLEFYLNPKYHYNEYDRHDYEYVNEIEQIWAVVCSSMWW